MVKKKTTKQVKDDFNYLAGYLPAEQPLSQEIIHPSNTSAIPTTEKPKFLFSIQNKESLGLPSGSATPVTTTSTATTLDKDMLVNFLSFFVVSRDSNATTGTATLPFFQCLINGVPIFTGALPYECDDAKDLVANQIIDTTDFFLPRGSTIQTLLGASATGGNGYASVVSFVISGVTI